MFDLRVFFSVIVAVSTVGATAKTEAKTELEEVVITATLRPQTALNVAASATVIDSSTLREAGVQHLQDVLPLIPNLNWAAGTSRPRYFQLRGIGENDQWQGAPNPSVGFLIDGMDFSGIGMPATLVDLEQAEVLRGPQSTSLGANALAGLINLRTRIPTPDETLRVEIGTGNLGVTSVGLVVGGPFAEGGDSAFRLVAQGFRSNGSRRNVTLDRDDTNGLDERTLRFRSWHELNTRWKADLSLLAVDLDNGFDAFSTDNSRRTRSDDPGRDSQHSRGASMVLHYDGGDFEFKNLTAVVDADIVYSFDGDWAADPSYDFTSRFLRDRQSLSQDLRWSRKTRAVDLVAGIYAQRLTEDNDQLDLYGGEVYRVLVSHYEARSFAGYASMGYSLSDAWRTNFGLRIERRDASYRDTDGSDLSPAESMLGGNASIEYRPDRQRMAYLAFARGYKAGGFNLGSVVPTDRREFDAEFLHSLELGYKFDDAIRGLRYDLAIFYMRRTAQQVNTSAQLDPGDPLSFIYLTDNAARGVNYGLEGSIFARLSEAWSIGATVGGLRAVFRDYIAVGDDLAGRDQAHAPSFQVSMSLDYRKPSGWFARLDAQRVAAFYFSDSHDQRSAPYSIVNVRAGFDAGHWRVDTWMRNALNARYAMRGFFFGNEPPDYPDKLYVQLADPRAVGVSAVWQVR
ncbi:MAG: TonB-dependent receptor [Gammaproteobacteria bacterium]|nr:TonB-dependent receptor [Gammaproteobacteria bacterium]